MNEPVDTKPEVAITSAPPQTTEPDRPTVTHSPRLTGRGAFLLILLATVVTCIVGFFVQGATVLPDLTAWGLIIGSLAAAATVNQTGRWYSVFAPPIVMALVIATLGQITLLGSTPTLAREITFFLATMADFAGIQLAAVLFGFAITWMRFRQPKI